MPVIINGTTGISGVDGSAGTPSYVGGDSDTGLWYPAANTLALSTSGSERLRIDSSGNVGIGTSSPQATLDVSYGNASRADTLRLTNTNTAGYGSWLNFYGNYNGGYSFAKIGAENDGTGGSMRFHTADTSEVSQERMRIDSSGNVGIGLNPSGNYQLEGGTGTSAASRGFNLMAVSGGFSGGDYPSIGYNFRTTASSGSYTYNATDTAARILFSNVGTTFSTAVSGTGGNAITWSERMRITSDGQVGIGQNPTSYAQLQVLFDATTAANNSLGIGISPVANTSNANFLQFYNATGNSCGNITRNGTSNAVLYNTSSDYRLKENINPMTGALAKVQLLKPVTWTWIEGKQAGEGFIAHELQEVIPFAVTGQKDEMQTYVDSEGVEKTRPKYQGLDASYLVATLTAAIQEQQAMIEELKAKVAALEK